MKVIVIGGGIVGASAAYYLVKNGVEVIIVDKEHEGKATSAGAGIVCPWNSRIKDDNWYQIAKKSAKYYPSLISQLEIDGEVNVGYETVGALYVSRYEEELFELEETLKVKRVKAPEIGDIIRLDSKQARKRFPLLDESLGAVFVSGAARVDGHLLGSAIKRASKKHGAKVIKGEASLLYDNGLVIGVTIGGEKKYADTVLITAGAWAASLLEPLGIGLKIDPERGQIVHIGLKGQDTSKWPVVLPQSSYYMVAFDDSRVVVGATRERGLGFDYRTTVAGINEVISEGLSFAPRLGSGTLEEVRIGFRPMGPDALPILGPIDSVKGIVLATGLGASGLTMGPYVGMLAAKIIKEEEIKLDISPYSPLRAIFDI